MSVTLTLPADRPFRILQLTDLHYTDGGEADRRTLRLLGQILTREQPDLAVLTGDTVYGPESARHLPEILRPLTDSAIPWTFVFGNHDTEEGPDEAALFAILKKLPGCLMENLYPHLPGFGNHEIALHDASGRLRWVLTLLDSGRYYPDPVGGYAMVRPEQVRWYTERMQAWSETAADFGNLVFLHMPLPEYNEVWETQVCYGEKLEEVCCPRLNSGFFAAMAESGHARGVFCGHDHINDYMGELYGVTLGYGRAGGYNTYGKDGFLRGARILELDAGDTRHFSTYIRLEDGQLLRPEDRVHRPAR